jgi:hypothetical protein
VLAARSSEGLSQPLAQPPAIRGAVAIFVPRGVSPTQRSYISCVELSFESGPPVEPARPLVEGLEIGAWHGAWAVLVGSLPSALGYLGTWGWMELPWGALGTQLGSFMAVCGAFYGAGIALGEALARELRVRPNLRPLLSMVLPASFGGLAGVLPGAFAAEQFGRIPAPYFGTLEILVAGVLSFFLLGATLLSREGVPPGRALPALALALLAPLACGLALWGVAPSTSWIVDSVVLRTADSLPSLALFGAAFGAFVGALFGGLLGFARALLAQQRPTRSLTPTRRTTLTPPRSEAKRPGAPRSTPAFR